MNKLLYLINVNWNWIKQRPQYLAEAMAMYLEVDVYEKKIYRKHNLVANSIERVKLHKLFRLPMQTQFDVIDRINFYLMRRQLLQVIEKYDYIWISNANDYQLIKDKISNQKIIYDCMDDYIEFPDVKKDKNKVLEYMRNEHDLLLDSNFVFTSAEYLKSIILSRYNDIGNDKINVINNAVTCKLLEQVNSDTLKTKNEKKVITYIGTISKWINWNFILKSLNMFDNIEYHFWGPKEVDIPQHNGVLYEGILPQNQIFTEMRKSDLLIMPFIINELILSVNPVKLYEYILSGVPALACGYSETEKFNEFVYLYYNEDDFIHIIKKLSEDVLEVKSNDGFNFVKNNTWESRAKTIAKIIGEYH